MTVSVHSSVLQRFNPFSTESLFFLDMEICKMKRWDAMLEYFKDFRELFKLVSALSLHFL